jgi:hypothetical protein
MTPPETRASPLSLSIIGRLAERERDFAPPAALVSALEDVRAYLAEELAEGAAESLSLVRAALVLSAAGDAAPSRRIPLSAGMEMVYHSLTAQRASAGIEEPSDLLGILSHDLVLARALDLYAADGDKRVMEAVSSGASTLSEALMSECADSSPDIPVRLAARFHGYCVRVGAAIAGIPEEGETRMADAAERRLRHSLHPGPERETFDSVKETEERAANEGKGIDPLLQETLSRWLASV